MNKREFAELFNVKHQDKVFLPRNGSLYDVCLSIIDKMTTALAAKETIYLRGLGTFSYRSYKRKNSINPKTQEKLKTNKTTNKIHFKVSNKLIKEINQW